MRSVQQVVVILAIATLANCKEERVEYHTRPAWHYSMMSSMQDEVVKEDGTVVKYQSIGGTNSSSVQQYLNSIELEKVDERTGEVTIHAVLPEHVLTQTLVCLRDRNWDLLYNQVLSESAKAYFGDQNAGPFETFFETNRRELAKSIQRMIQGKSFGDVFMTERDNIVTLSFSPRMIGNFKYKKFTLERDGEFLKLRSIE